MNSVGASAPAELEFARRCVKEGRIEQAEQAYLGALKQFPDDVESLNFVGMCALERGRPAAALDLLSRAAQRAPADPVTLKNLACVQLATGQIDEALRTLQTAIRNAPEFFTGRLYLGLTYERLMQPRQALAAYFRAITQAQTHGQWLDDRTTPPGLREVVKHATHYVVRGRAEWSSSLLEPLRARYGSDALRRVEHTMAVYLGDAPREYADPRQIPRFLYFPGLPPRAYFERERFAWIDALESRTEAIRQELLSVLTGDVGIEPFNRYSSQAEAEQYLRAASGPPRWDAYFFYRHGERYGDNHARCPQTSAAIEQLPLTRIREHAPETCFSILPAGTHILPHRGVTNTRLVVHLPLIVPEDCALRVGAETHVWREGRCVIFDDTFEHEAWNRSTQTRAVLIMDVWNPHLTDAEQAALTDLVAAIGDFNRECEQTG